MLLPSDEMSPPLLEVRISLFDRSQVGRLVLSIRHYHHHVTSHRHDHAQLVFGLSGALALEIDGRQNLALPDRAAVIPAGCVHAFAGESQCLVLDAPGEESALQDLLGGYADAGRRVLTMPQCVPLNPMAAGMVRWLADAPYLDDVLARHGAAVLLAAMSEAVLPAPGLLPLTKLNQYIDQHCAHPLSVADLARQVHLSPSHFHARFISELGLAPMEYVRQRRMQHAQYLLQSTALPIGEVGERVGYASQSAFAQAVRRAYGLAPLTLRRQAQSASQDKTP
ncbi:AraC family transcriptional regulator [Chitinivorax sp. B]|uniref:helix-turn-helix transcriptional regulator n=1 Tax=Chitinivorax sp. B TaxID=2502235 RepID=UPI0020174C83|nr:AraC family transcriptional regulator [Chitinivorax sp. B]